MKNKLFAILFAASIGLALIVCMSSCSTPVKACHTYAGTGKSHSVNHKR